MKCPACGNALTEKTVDPITLDVCQGGCGGIWFDNFELQKVDECPACAGMWLDEGELASIRDQYPTEAERKRATEDYFNDVFGHELAQMQAESEEKREKAGRIARIFRFICPSYYISGKQSWGAF